MKLSYEAPRAALLALLAIDIIAASAAGGTGGDGTPPNSDPLINDPGNW